LAVEAASYLQFLITSDCSVSVMNCSIEWLTALLEYLDFLQILYSKSGDMTPLRPSPPPSPPPSLNIMLLTIKCWLNHYNYYLLRPFFQKFMQDLDSTEELSFCLLNLHIDTIKAIT